MSDKKDDIPNGIPVVSFSDDDDDDDLETIIKRDKEKWKKKAQSTKFSGRNKDELYREARLIDRELQKAFMSHDWLKVYYFLHLYMTICFEHKLHKGDKSETRVVMALENLKQIEKKMKIAEKGIPFQYHYARDQEARELARKQQLQREEEQRKAAAAAVRAPPLAPGAPALSLEQMNAAMDALRMPGQASSFATIPQAVMAMSAAPVVGQVLEEAPPVDIPPPPYNGATLPNSVAPPKYGGMSQKNPVPARKVQSLVLKRVLGDGSCAFRSIAQGLNQGKLSPDQEKRKADELRRLVVTLLQQRGQEEMVGTGMTIEQVVLMKDSYSSYAAYCNAMSRSEYAGETEFWLLAEELEIRISIFMWSDDNENELEHLITYGTAPVDPVFLFWQRGSVSEAGNHYDCLLPEE